MNTLLLPERRSRRLARRATLVAALLLGATAWAQQPATPPEAAAPPPAPPSQPQAQTTSKLDDSGALAALAWLEGCWQGTVNQREFREHWLPPRGGMLIGAGQSVLRGKMQDYEFLRIEPKSDGVFFSQFGGDRKETSFRLDKVVNEDKDTIFTFANTADAFPARLIYRRGTEGWLYETIEGKMNGTDRQVIYPMRRVDCETSELINK
jgi:hypothetical protein